MCPRAVPVSSRTEGGSGRSPPATTHHPFPLQTFVNEARIPDQKYVTLKLNDVIRFGYDILPGAACLPWSPRAQLPCDPGGGWGPGQSQLRLQRESRLNL